jgi:hypothetical protein
LKTPGVFVNGAGMTVSVGRNYVRGDDEWKGKLDTDLEFSLMPLLLNDLRADMTPLLTRAPQPIA